MRSREAAFVVLEALWDPIWCPNPSKSHSKSNPSHQKLSWGSLFGTGRVQETLQDCPGTTPGRLGGIPDLILGWFWGANPSKTEENPHPKIKRFQNMFFNVFR